MGSVLGGQTATVLYQDDGVIAQVEAAHTRYQQVARRRQDIHDAARAAYRTAQAAWDERQEQQAYNAFMREYGESSLWEGHRKTITLPAMPESPDQPRHSSRRPGTSWFTALTALIESGANLADYTLGQALEAQGMTDVPATLFALPLCRPT